MIVFLNCCMKTRILKYSFNKHFNLLKKWKTFFILMIEDGCLLTISFQHESNDDFSGVYESKLRLQSQATISIYANIASIEKIFKFTYPNRDWIVSFMDTPSIEIMPQFPLSYLSAFKFYINLHLRWGGWWREI